jgi:DNA-binding NarL/FixJ family response regulator
MKQQPEKSTKVLLVENRRLFRAGLRKILDATSDIRVVGEVGSYADTLTRVGDLKPDVVVLGQLTGGPEPVAAAQRAITDGLFESTRVLVLADPQEAHMSALRDLPTHSTFVTSTGPHEFCGGIRILAAGYTFQAQRERRPNDSVATSRPERSTAETITHRESDILGLLACGHTNSEMARRLSLTESTVKSHVQSLLRKLQLPNRVSVVIYAYETGLIKVGEKSAKILHLSERTKTTSSTGQQSAASGRFHVNGTVIES